MVVSPSSSDCSILDVTLGPEFRAKLEYRVRMALVRQCAQFFFEVGVIGQVAFATPVVVPGGLGCEIPDLRSQRAHESIHLAAGELFSFNDALPQ